MPELLQWKPVLRQGNATKSINLVGESLDEEFARL